MSAEYTAVERRFGLPEYLTKADLAARALFLGSIAAEAKARADAARAQLDAIARDEYKRDGTAPTWRIPGIGTVPLALNKASVDVVDQAAYIEWVHGRYPDEITVTVLTEVRPAFDKHLRETAASRGAACDDEGTVIPGLVYRPGGTARGVSIRAEPAAKAEAVKAASAFLDSLIPPEDSHG